MDSTVHDDRCRADLGRCDAYRPGHALHFIHARLIGENPGGWRTVTVSRLEGRELLLVDEAGAVVVAWHHRLLTDIVAPGDRVAVHARHSAVAAGGAVLNVRLTGTLSADLPASEEVAPPTTTIVDLASGRGLTTEG